MENVEQETRTQPSRLEGPEGAPLSGFIEAVITVGVLSFWFGVGAALGAKMGPLRGPEVPQGPHG